MLVAHPSLALCASRWSSKQYLSETNRSKSMQCAHKMCIRAHPVPGRFPHNEPPVPSRDVAVTVANEDYSALQENGGMGHFVLDRRALNLPVTTKHQKKISVFSRHFPLQWRFFVIKTHANNTFTLHRWVLCCECLFKTMRVFGHTHEGLSMEALLDFAQV